MVETQSSGLFSIFLISIYTLILVPVTAYRLCCGQDASSSPVQPWQQGKKKSKLAGLVRKYCNKGNLVLLLLWVGWWLLLLWVQASLKDMKPFDPFEILGVDASATDRDIKKAYRTLSLKYHPDKNPDPAATQYFAEYITKAYAALTDEVSRQNFEKYGHPDGPQAVNVGVALPDWMFAKDKRAAPLMLLALVCGGILAPLVAVSVYMTRTKRFAGPNNVMAETLAVFLHSKFSIKESQSLVRIPETLVVAMEFILLATPAEHTAPMDELRKALLRVYPELKDRPAFLKRKASVIKVHMLLLAYLARSVDIPPCFKADLAFVLQKAPLLLEEMFKIACLPRPPMGYGWLTPAVGVLELQQCIAQAMTTSDRRPQGRAADATTLLLQLPHFDADVVKKLRRRRVASIKELMDLGDSERVEALAAAGLSATAIEDVATFLSVLPTVHARVSLQLEGGAEIMEQDVVTCKVRLVLTRPSHKLPTFEPPAKGKAVAAYVPQYGQPHDETWYILLADPAANNVLCQTRVSLAEAEAVGYARPELVDEWAAMTAAGGDPASAPGKEGRPGRAAVTASKFIRSYKAGGSVGNGLDGAAAGEEVPAPEAGQLVELMFMAPFKAGKYDLQVLVMCDSYVGCDRTIPVRLRVAPLTKAALEARAASAAGANKRVTASDDESQDGRAGADAGSEAGSDDGSSDEDEVDYEYDSEETGELESGSDDDDYEDESPPVKSGKPGAAKAGAAGKPQLGTGTSGVSAD